MGHLTMRENENGLLIQQEELFNYLCGMMKCRMMKEQKLFDPLRRKWVAGTPEEAVRQGVIAWLHQQLGAPLTLMASEYGFAYNGRQYRADIVVFDRELKPLLLVECKAPEVTVDQTVVEQALRYNRVLDVKFIMVTNGKTSYICRRKADGGGVFEQLASFPTYEEMLASSSAL